MSIRRHGLELMRYSLSPERYIRRVMATSSKSTGNIWSELSSTSVTSTTPTGLRADEPEKMTSSMAWPRSCLALCSPRTHRIESEMFDFPEPFGPTMTVRPGSNVIWARSANDLNPLSVRDLRYTVPRLHVLLVQNHAVGGVTHAVERFERGSSLGFLL